MGLLAQVKQEYERSLTEFDSKIMEQVDTFFFNRVPQCNVDVLRIY